MEGMRFNHFSFFKGATGHKEHYPNIRTTAGISDAFAPLLVMRLSLKCTPQIPAAARKIYGSGQPEQERGEKIQGRRGKPFENGEQRSANARLLDNKPDRRAIP